MAAEDQRKRISSLNHRRGTLKAQLTTFQRFMDNLSEPFDRMRLRVRMDNVSKAFEKFDDIQTELEMLDTEIDHVSAREEIMETYYDSLARAENLLQATALASRNSIESPITITSTNSVSHIKLPEINIPTFDGSLERWLSFRDSFCSMIDRKPGLTGVDKLHYLRSFLSGEALSTIESLEMTDQNYTEAWQLLNETYDNKRVIILRHSHLLLNLPAVSMVSPSGIRELINQCTQHLRCLKALGQQIEHWDTLLVTAIQAKLDVRTLREWESTLANNCVPSFNDLIAFLRKIASRLQSSVPSSAQINDTRFKNTFKPVNSSAQTKSKTLVVNVSKCPVCAEAHSIANCKKFTELKVTDRIEAARKAYLCLNCLHAGHRTAQCISTDKCHICTKRHNTLLHMVTNTDHEDISNLTEL